MKKAIKKTEKQPELATEVAALAEQVLSGIKNAVKSKELKDIGREVKKGLRTTSGRIVSAFQKAQTSEATEDIKCRAKRVVQIGKSQGERTVKNIRQNLAKGLDGISKELQNLAGQLKKN